MTNRKRIVPVVASSLASALCIGALAVPMSTYTPQAYADTYSDLVNAQNSHAQSKQREAALREQLAGVNSDLADKIVELDDLNNNKIPAAQAKVQQANSDAAAAKSEADAAAERLKAAEKDKADLEAKIKQTGEDYDDAHAAVAQSARESMHGSDTSDVMSVMTGSKDTKDFIKSMQSRDALARNEANAASDAAVDLNTSMNRADRLKAIEKRVEQCKNDADQKSAAAHSAATQAQQEKSSLDKLRAAGESTRADLENQKSSLTTQAAQQAAQTVMLQSEIDAKNQQWAAEQAAAAAQVQEPEPQGTVEAPAAAAPQPSVPQQTQTPSQPAQTQRPSTPSQPSIPSQPSTPSTPVVTRPSTGGQGTSNGDYGNAYAAGQCTWWAYERRKQMGIGTPSYLGNGGQWWSTAPSYGLRVDHSPQVGAALSFLPGQEGASSPWGHVAVVEQVNGNSILISESNVAGLYTITYRTLYNPGRFWYVH
ncbi:CHAP domain-containing protein [Bifidobacterium animalis]|uniref:CHAP domain-containing protein n=1 Tax=Bifidobacterium animalis TaxID=28025 RepID=UPI000AE86B70|nr:CHAP domain-containing protein [Bifidobacterium animalis]MCR1994857.1 CHAP domain-containing protein [Bifidobacterium animalis subsp. animalis]QQQ90406.1 CHAP domain-containing protein [Bifidobacterium animalis]UQE63504.1 CHAP domain-containing protein [Bifidobacterium animalis]